MSSFGVNESPSATGVKRSRTEMEAPAMEHEVNVVIVGGMGAGKTTWARFQACMNLSPAFLARLAEDAKARLLIGVPVDERSRRQRVGVDGSSARSTVYDEMVVGHGTVAATTRTRAFCFVFDHDDGRRYLINFIDTPGLNEANTTTDLHQMLDLLKTLRDIGRVHYVIFCQPWNARLTAQDQKTFAYFEQLLEPLFLAGKVALVGTKVDLGHYGETEEDHQRFYERAHVNHEGVAGTLKNHRHVAVRQCVRAETVTSVLEAGVEALLDRQKQTDSLLAMSLSKREEMLGLLFAEGRSFGVPMNTLQFPLPPAMDARRRSQVTLLGQSREQTTLAIATLEEHHATLLEQMKAVEHKIECTSALLNATEDELAEKSCKHKCTAPVVRGGQDFFKFGGTADALISCPVADFKVEAEAHNASYEQKSIVERDTGKDVCFGIKPRFLNWGTKTYDGKDYHWYIKMRLVYDNGKVFPADVERLTRTVEDLRNRRQTELGERNMIQSRLHHAEGELEGHRERLQKTDRALGLLDKQLYNINDVLTLVDLIPAMADGTQ